MTSDNSFVPIIIDVEASGFGTGSYPIEIGFALPDHERHCYLIRPAESWSHWAEEAEKIHGISRSALLKHGHAIPEVAMQLNHYLAGKVVYSDAWSYDSSWIYKLFDEAAMTPRFRVETLRKLLNEEQLKAWDLTRQQITNELAITRHRASADAHVLQLTYLKITHQI
ncbi:hypothetical protein ACFSJ3_04425 [Corallincola platygyrae]|uniref:Exonuclease domain-containing protein n=1 Tax=Corallincola platygyrae TaxID=1193278 RepID=A0ABW4XI53_9GAMM